MLCKEQREIAQHLLTGWKMLASSEYLVRHNKALTVMAVVWAKEQNLFDQNLKWYQENWNREHVLKNPPTKLVWDFELNYGKRQHLVGQI